MNEPRVYEFGTCSNSGFPDFLIKFKELKKKQQLHTKHQQEQQFNDHASLHSQRNHHSDDNLENTLVVKKDSKDFLYERYGIRLPRVFDRRYTMNFSIVSSKKKKEKKKKDEFLREALSYYYAYLQKKSISKMQEMTKSRKELTIASYEEEIVNAVKKHQVTIIAGDTGCGKSTQVPQFILEKFQKKIACTQPRRLSTMALCRRVAYETFNENGNRIAYQIRFDSSSTFASKMIFLTEGVLLRYIQNDKQIMKYDVIILDEVHERHITTDLLLAFIKQALEKRPELRLVLMSATINIQHLQSFFSSFSNTFLQVPGRMFPVQVHYLPISQEEEQQPNPTKQHLNATSLYQFGDVKTQSSWKKKPLINRKKSFDCRPYVKILARIDREIPLEERGDLLIFVNGMYEIQLLVEKITEYAALATTTQDHYPRWLVLPLHSTLSIEEQEKVFHFSPFGVRKCIISTNIAETSITIVGIRFVIDSGKVNEANYDPLANIHQLQETWITQSSAEQRKGRAGRTGPGQCFRLYSSDDFHHQFLQFPIPEMLRSSLNSVLLLLKSLHVQDVRNFPFLDTPPQEHFLAAIQSLYDLHAIEQLEEGGRVGAPVVAGAPPPQHQSQHQQHQSQSQHHQSPPQIFHKTTTTTTTTTNQNNKDCSFLDPTLSDEDVLFKNFKKSKISAFGKLLVRFPIDLCLGKMLILSCLLEPHLQKDVLTLASLMSVQSLFMYKKQPFVKTTSSFSSSPKSLVEEEQHSSNNSSSANTSCQLFDSVHGDPFTLLNVFNEWMKIKAKKKFSSRKWCKQHHLQEQRLYEVVKLRKHYKSILEEVGLLTHSESCYTRRKRKRDPSSEYLRQLKLKRAVEANKNKKFLSLKKDSEEDNTIVEQNNSSTTTNYWEMEEEEINHVDNVEFYLFQDTFELEKAASYQQSKSSKEMSLLKFIVSASFPKSLAFQNPLNATRPLVEQTYLTWQSGEMYIHPSSVLSCGIDREAYLACNLALGDMICFTSILQTRKLFLTNNLRVKGLPTALLNAQTIDIDVHCSFLLVDKWLLFEMKHPQEGEQAIEMTFQLRQLLQLVLNELVKSCSMQNTLKKNNDADADDADADDADDADDDDAADDDDGSTGSGEDDFSSFLPPFLQKLLFHKKKKKKKQRESERHHYQDGDHHRLLNRDKLVGLLMEFLDMSFEYKISKPTTSQLQALFNASPILLDVAGVKKGVEGRGVVITDYLTFGSLGEMTQDLIPEGLFTECLRMKWTCPFCKKCMVEAKSEIQKHQTQCCLPASTTTTTTTTTTDQSTNTTIRSKLSTTTLTKPVSFPPKKKRFGTPF